MQKENKVCNITPANRVGSVQEYYFSKKLKEVAEMNAAGKNVINLGVGSPDLPPSEQTIETLCEHARKANEHGYQPYVGIPELRKGFADWYKTWYDVDLDPKTEIQPLIGSKEGILHISLAFLNPGDGVLVPNPGYPTYSSVSKLVEARLIPYELKEELGWQADFEELEKMDLSNVKLMWTNYPNMPTGANASVELYEKLVAFGRKHGIIICNDNPYSLGPLGIAVLLGDLGEQLRHRLPGDGQHLHQQRGGVDAVLAGDVAANGHAAGGLAADDGVRLRQLGGHPLEAHRHLVAFLAQPCGHAVQQVAAF